MKWLSKYQKGGEIESNFGSDLYTRMMNTITTFGGSAIGDAVEGISPKVADWLEKYSAGMIPHTSEEMMKSNRGSGSNKLKQANDAANSVAIGLATQGLGKIATPYLRKGYNALKAAKAAKEFKKLPFNHPDIKSISGPLSKEMEPWLSRYEKPISREEEVFENFLSPEHQSIRQEARTVHLDREGNVIKNKYQQGGIIEDDRGQWAHPGEITKINSNNITMKGVNYPVLGISDEGDKQMMYPEGEYTFKGNNVTEYPLKAQNGMNINNIKNPTPPTEEEKGKVNAWMDELKYMPIKNREDHSESLLRPFAVRDNDHIQHGDYTRYYVGLPLRGSNNRKIGVSNYDLRYSKYKPTKSKNPDAKYIANQDPMFKDQILDYFNKNYKGKTLHPSYNYAVKEEDEKIDNKYYRGMSAPAVSKVDVKYMKKMKKEKGWENTFVDLGNFTVDFGEDEKGNYISYYDVWNKKFNDNPDLNKTEYFGIAKPFEIYDRIYVNKDSTGKYIPKNKKLQKGGQLQKSNKSTNFTSPNSWLDKYTTTT